MTTIELFTPERIEADLAGALRARRLPDHFLYAGEVGAASWIDLDGSSAFGVASTLTELLRASVADLTAPLPADVNVAGIGIGSGEKERLVLEALIARGGHPAYVPVDVSDGLVRRAVGAVADLDLASCTGVTARLEEKARELKRGAVRGAGAPRAE